MSSHLCDKIEDELVNVTRPLLAKSKQVNSSFLDDAIYLSRKLSYTVQAPKGWNSDQELMLPPPFKPAFPDIEQLKRGILYTKEDKLVEMLLDAAKESVILKKEDEIRTVRQESMDLVTELNKSEIKLKEVSQENEESPKSIKEEENLLNKDTFRDKFLQLKKKENAFNLDLSSSESDGDSSENED